MAWPTSILDDGREVANQVAAPAETRTPNLHRAQIAHQECGWKGGDSGGGHNVAAQSIWRLETGLEHLFLPCAMLAERSSPSRVRFAAQSAPLTAPGRSAQKPLGRKRKNYEREKQTRT